MKGKKEQAENLERKTITIHRRKGNCDNAAFYPQVLKVKEPEVNSLEVHKTLIL